METRFCNRLWCLFASGAALWLVAPRISAEEARFFRIVGPTVTSISSFTPDGYINWSNAQPGSTYTVQTAARLGAATNWLDYIQVPAGNNVVTQRLYDPNPPSGMVLIPAGSFTMGDIVDGSGTSLPLHTVYVSAFYMDQYLMTKSLWDTVYQWATNHGYTFDYAGSGKASNHPVQTIDWYDCVKWCNARSEKEGRVPAYYTNAAQTVVYRSGEVDVQTNWVNWSSGYRLPTEAEWEKAARGGVTGQRFPWGDTISWGQANYYSYWSGSVAYYPYDVNPTSGYNPAWTGGGTPYTTPVGYFAANGYGLYDMAGNVWQWCWDWYAAYSSGSQTDPRGPASGWDRVNRGGGWRGNAIFCRTADHDYYPPMHSYYAIGFRSVLPLDQ
jgi:formylglycine-generating enzyme